MIKAILTLVAVASMRDKTLASHINQHGFLCNVTDSKWKGKKGKRVKKRAFPYLSKLERPVKIYHGNPVENDTGRPGFEWHGGFGQSPLQTGIYFPLSSCFRGGGGKGKGRKWPSRRSVALNIFWFHQVVPRGCRGRS